MPDHHDEPNNVASWISQDNGAHDETLVDNWLLRLRRERLDVAKERKDA